MRQWFGVVVFALVMGQSAWADERSDGIAATILGQMQAFEAEDTARAFGFAAPKIKAMFATPDNFAAMVRQGYPMVWDHSGVRLLELREIGGGLWQRVLVTDQSGRSHLLDYQMLETSEGWQIGAVRFVRSAGVGA